MKQKVFTATQLLPEVGDLLGSFECQGWLRWWIIRCSGVTYDAGYQAGLLNFMQF